MSSLTTIFLTSSQNLDCTLSDNGCQIIIIIFASVFTANDFILYDSYFSLCHVSALNQVPRVKGITQLLSARSTNENGMYFRSSFLSIFLLSFLLINKMSCILYTQYHEILRSHSCLTTNQIVSFVSASTTILSFTVLILVIVIF